jgi:UDP-N-acetyl-2-amino-2-deoxyglucuronate dehydrogenase
VHAHTPSVASGFIELTRARVRWFLSIDCRFLPFEIQKKGGRTYRSILINNEEIEFSDGFTDLHTLSYQKIMDGEGFRLEDAYPYVSLCQQVRDAEVNPSHSEHHPFYAQI